MRKWYPFLFVVFFSVSIKPESFQPTIQQNVYYYAPIQAKVTWEPFQVIYYGWKLQSNGKILPPSLDKVNKDSINTSHIRNILISAHGNNQKNASKRWNEKEFLSHWESSLTSIIHSYPALESIQLDFEGFPKESAMDFFNFVCHTSQFLMQMEKKDRFPHNSQTKKKQKLGTWKSNYSLSLALFPPDHPDNQGFHDWNLLTKCSDTIFVMLYDYHNPRTQPGPVSQDEWILKNLSSLPAAFPKEKIFLGLPLYGYEWNKNGKFKRHVSYKDWKKNPKNSYNNKWNLTQPIDTNQGILYPPPPVEWIESWLHFSREKGYGGIVLWRWGF